MNFATVDVGVGQTYGAVVDGRSVNGGRSAAHDFIDLAPHFPAWSTLRHVIAAEGMETLAQVAPDLAVTHRAGSFRFAIPVPDAEKIICVGINYPARNEEYADGQALPRHMSLFPRFARSFVGHEQPLLRPRESHQLDYEGEIAVIIGKGGRRITERDALQHVAAVTLANEGTIRDWTRHAKFNVTQGKNWDCSGAIGPWLAPITRPQQLDGIRLQTRVNGALRQDDTSTRMLFPVARQIAYISTFTTLVPGDIILTGTPTGAGARLDPPRYLEPGDVVEVEASGIGTLRNPVVDE